MSKLTKISSVTLGLILLSLLLPLMVTSAIDASIPAPLLILRNLTGVQLPFRHIVATYTFWVALVFSLLIVIGILVILVFPRLRTSVPLADKGGQLTLTKSAIDGLVKSVVVEQGLMADPKVITKLYKRRFKVKVLGQVVPKYDVVNRTNRLKTEIERVLKDFVGLDQPLDVTVVVKQVEETETTKKRRVI